MSDWAYELRIAKLEARVKQLEEYNAAADRAVEVLESQCEQLVTIMHTCETWGGFPGPCPGCRHHVRKPTPV